MREVAMEEQGGEITDAEWGSSAGERSDTRVSCRGRVRPPLSVLWSTVLYCAELVAASVLCRFYHQNNDVIWMSFTIGFVLLPAVLIQLTLTFVHRDLGRDRPLVLFLHLLMLGPVIRCYEALVVYFKAGKKEEPYVTLTKKISLEKGCETPMELEIGHTERRLAVHRNAFKRTAVIQAFLGSTPQLTLQLYATIQEKYIFFPARNVLMVIALASIVYGALVCSVLSIQIIYDDYKVRLRPTAYLCMVLWRGLEITTRITALVLFSTALTHWVVLVGLSSLVFFFFLPWVEFWAKRGSLTEGLENNFSKVGDTVVLCMFTLLYACINVFCWSAMKLDLAHHELIDRKQSWGFLALYYSLRFVENFALITFWYFFKSDFYEYVCAPLLAVQLLVCYGLAVLFMLFFYQFCHPCRHCFAHNVHDCLRCVCCQPKAHERTSYSTAATMLLVSEEPLELRDAQHPSRSRLLEERETEA